MFKDWSWKQLALPLLLIAAVLINKTMVQPTAAKPANADATEFSAERALEHVRSIATEPHPVGTPANKRVRNDLVAHLQAAGLEVEVQSTQIIDSYRSNSAEHYAGVPRHRHSAAFVHNVIARLKGTGQKGKALALMSHYDSVYYGPGAGDDAAGTAAILETLRALQAGDPLENDVILLITDAEEVGLFGAQAFFEKHRWANDIGLVLNFEARGSKGPVSMFQTSPLNDQLVEVFANTVDRPLANSLTVTIYRNMPNDTDMSISLADDIPGMNFAFIEGFYDYHTKGDNAENLSLDTLQHMGDQALAMTRAMGNIQLPLKDTKEVVFFDVLTLFMVSYPVWVSWLVAGIAVAALVLHARGKVTAGQLSLKGLIKGFLAVLLFIVGFALIVDVLFLMIGGRSGDMVEGRRLFALSDTQLLAFSLIGLGFALAWFRMLVVGFSINWAAAGAVLSVLLLAYEATWIPAAVAIVLTAASYGLFRDPINNDERLFASLDFYLLAALATQFFAPAGSHLFIWPFIFLVAGLHLHVRGMAGLFTISLLSLLGCLWLLYFTEMGYSALGIAFPSVIAVPFGLLLIMLVPTFLHVTRNSHRTIALASGTIGLVLVGYAAVSTGFTDRHNKPTEAFYLVDAKEDGENHYGTRLNELDKWSEQLIAGPTDTIRAEEIIPSQRGDIKISNAPSSSVEKLSITDANHSGDAVSFTLTPGYRGDIIAVAIESTQPMGEIRIAGEALRKADTPPTSIILYYFAVPQAGLPLYVVTEGDITVHAAEITSDWPEDVAASIPAKPDDIMIAPYRFSDSTISSAKLVISANQ